MKKVGLVLIMVLGIALSLLAQDFYDAGVVNEIRLYFTQSNWDTLLDQLFSAGQDGRLLGTAVINGVTYDSVGVKYKGNSSYNASRLKNPFNIKLDYIRKDQLLDDKYGTIKLSNGFSDPTLVRETLSYEIARKYMPASRANYANVYVNDALIGIYTNVQDVDTYFMNEYFHCSGKPRFKCDTNTMNAVTVWGYLGADSSAYSQYYGLESDYGWAQLINFTNVLSNNQANIANVMNVDQNLWMTAFDNLFVNLDSPINIFHNFYLFGDASNRINPILWDLNMSFGGFGGGGGTVTQMQNYDPLKNSTSNTFYLISHVLSNVRYKKMYIAHMRTMLQENISNGWYLTRANELQAICGPSVQSDTHYFYTYANFQANINSAVTGGSGGPGGGSIPGLTQLMAARATYLLSSTAFQGTVPTISSINHTPENPVQYGTVNFTMNTINATYAQIGIRQDIADKFTYYQMYDDGAHNDEASGDGVFGVTIEIGFGDIQYYGYAENTSQGAFLPARAEHEFFDLPVYTNPGELVINEIMAKNTLYPDPNGDLDDWVEIYNTTGSPIDLGGKYLVDSHYSTGISAWTHIPTNAPATTTIPAHGYIVVWFDEEPDQGPLHINNKLSGAADAVYLIDSDGSTVLDNYIWTEAAGLNADDVSLGRAPDGSNVWQLYGAGQNNPSTPGSSNQGGINTAPIVSNISYSPNPASADNAISVSAQVIDPENNLTNVQLMWGTADVTQNNAVMMLQGGVYTYTIGTFADDTVIHFAIKATDSVNANTQSQVYNIIIGYTAPTLYINEIMPSNSATITDNYNEYEDWVEIYNPNDFPVNLAGYYFVDNHYGDNTYSIAPIKSTQADSTTVAAHGFKLFWFDEDPEQGIMHIDNKLSMDADAVYLIAPDMLNVIDHVIWASETGLLADISYGRYPDGSEVWTRFGGEYINPSTPGTNNAPVSNDDNNVVPANPVMSLYPNPFKGSLNLLITNTKTPIKVQVYNIKGSLIKDITYLPGGKSVWDGTDNHGKKTSSGLYIIKASVGNKNLTGKICLIH